MTLSDETAGMEIHPAKLLDSNILTYEYGVRLDKECSQAAAEQIIKARRLYNEIVATIRTIVEDMNLFLLQQGGPAAAKIQAQIEAFNEAFVVAKADKDEEGMKRIAQERRLAWREQSVLMRGVRSAHKAEVANRFLSRIGKNSKCDTYQLRGKAVAGGLGWATANAILDAALLAFKKSFVLGRAPRFSIGAEKIQDTLTLQFTTAGGAPVADLLAGRHSELAILPTAGVGRRKYGDFRFRLGTAKQGTNATGTWQYHRPLPESAYVGLARLVHRKIGKDARWALQLIVKLPTPIREASDGKRAPLVSVHFGWSADVSGRRVAGISDSADPGAAQVLRLPADIETSLKRAAAIQGERDTARDEIVPLLRELVLPENVPEEVKNELAGLQRLPAQYLSANRLHRLCRVLRENEVLAEWLETWRKADRMRWQATTHIARRARNARKDFYRNTAISLARQYEVIAIEPLDLADTAKKVDENSGEKSDFTRKARAGRVVAAISEFEGAIRWAAAKAGTAVLELSGETARSCSICGGTARDNKDDGQILNCDQCGAVLDRKQNGAALAWQATHAVREDVVEEYWLNAATIFEERRQDKIVKLSKMAEGRKNARTVIADEQF